MSIVWSKILIWGKISPSSWKESWLQVLALMVHEHPVKTYVNCASERIRMAWVGRNLRDHLLPTPQQQIFNTKLYLFEMNICIGPYLSNQISASFWYVYAEGWLLNYLLGVLREPLPKLPNMFSSIHGLHEFSASPSLGLQKSSIKVCEGVEHSNVRNFSLEKWFI